MSFLDTIDKNTPKKRKTFLDVINENVPKGKPVPSTKELRMQLLNESASERANREANFLLERVEEGSIRQDRPIKRLGREALRNVLEIGGLTLGGTLGSGGGASGTVVGSGLGYAGGKHLADLLLNKRYPSVTDKGVNLSDIALSLGKTSKDILEGAEMEMVGQVLGKVATSVISKGAAPFIAKAERNRDPFSIQNRLNPKESRLEISTPQLKATLKAYEEIGAKPLPSELFPKSRTLSILDSVLSYTPLSADTMFKKSIERLDALNAKRLALVTERGSPKQIEIVGNDIKREANDLISRYSSSKGAKLQNQVDDFLKKFTSPLDNVKEGQGFQDILAKNLSKRQQAVRDAYTRFNEALGADADTIIPPSPRTRTLANNLIKSEIAKPLKAQNKEAVDFLMPFSSMGEGGYKFEALKGTRTNLNERIQSLLDANNGISTNEVRIYNSLSDAIEKDMDNFVGGLGEDTKSLYQTAKGLSKETHELYDKRLAKIMRLDPEDVLRKVVNNGEFSIIQDIKNAIGDEGLKPIRRSYFKKLFTGAEDATGNINPLKLKNKFKSLTPETQKILLADDQIYAVNKLAEEGLFNKNRMGKMKAIEFLETVTGEPGGKVVDFLFKPENRENVRLAKRLFTPQRIKDIQQQAIIKVLKETPEHNYLPLQSAKEFVRYNAPLRELLDKETYKTVSDFITTGSNAKRVEQLAINASQTGQVVIGHGAMMRAIGLLARPSSIPGQIGGTISTLGMPYIIAKIYTSDAARDLLTSALKLPPNSPAAIKLFIQSAIIASKNDEQEGSEGREE